MAAGRASETTYPTRRSGGRVESAACLRSTSWPPGERCAGFKPVVAATALPVVQTKSVSRERSGATITSVTVSTVRWRAETRLRSPAVAVAR